MAAPVPKPLPKRPHLKLSGMEHGILPVWSLKVNSSERILGAQQTSLTTCMATYPADTYLLRNPTLSQEVPTHNQLKPLILPPKHRTKGQCSAKDSAKQKREGIPCYNDAAPPTHVSIILSLRDY